MCNEYRTDYWCLSLHTLDFLSTQKETRVMNAVRGSDRGGELCWVSGSGGYLHSKTLPRPKLHPPKSCRCCKIKLSSQPIRTYGFLFKIFAASLLF